MYIYYDTTILYCTVPHYKPKKYNIFLKLALVAFKMASIAMFVQAGSHPDEFWLGNLRLGMGTRSIDWMDRN